jgi:tetratricopeptide (TPR) repeat protein
MYAAMKGHADIVKALLDKEANVNIKDRFYFTALTWAEDTGQTEIVRLFKKPAVNEDRQVQINKRHDKRQDKKKEEKRNDKSNFPKELKEFREEFKKEYKELKELNINDAEVFLRLGEKYNNLPFLEKAAKLDPDNAKANYALGIHYYYAGQYIFAADRLYKAGLLYIKKGDREKALEIYSFFTENVNPFLKIADSKEIKDNFLKKLYPAKFGLIK